MRTKAVETQERWGFEELFHGYAKIGTNLAVDLVRKILSDAAGAVIGK